MDATDDLEQRKDIILEVVKARLRPELYQPHWADTGFQFTNVRRTGTRLSGCRPMRYSGSSGDERGD